MDSDRNLPEVVHSETLPPQQQQTVQVLFWRVSPRMLKVLSVSGLVVFAGWLLQNFFQLRGVVNLLLSRIVLLVLTVVLFLIGALLTSGARRKRLWRLVVAICVLAVAGGLERVSPKPASQLPAAERVSPEPAGSAGPQPSGQDRGSPKPSRAVATKPLPRAPRSQPAPQNETIQSASAELRMICALRDVSKMPDDTVGGFTVSKDPSHLEGAPGKVILDHTNKVHYQRTEQEGNVSVVQGYVLPPRSDLIGKPLPELNNYEMLVLNAYGAEGNYMSSCSFFEATFRVNGSDVYRSSGTIPPDQGTIQEGQNRVLWLHFRHLELPN